MHSEISGMINMAIARHIESTGLEPDFLIIGRQKLLALISAFHYIRTIRIEKNALMPIPPSMIMGYQFLVVEDDIITTAQLPEKSKL
jgi:hypothetical protein